LFDPPGRPLFKLPGANAYWRWQFRYRGSRCKSAVAQLFSLGGIEHYENIPIPFCIRGLFWSCYHTTLFAPAWSSDSSEDSRLH
jgi:hypothetical protein